MATDTVPDEKLIDVLHYIAKERNIPFEMLLEALEAALLTAYKRHFGSESNAIVTVDRQIQQIFFAEARHRESTRAANPFIQITRIS